MGLTATRLYVLLAALMGAAGVALLASGAHASGGQATTAGQMLLFHAPAIIAIALARKQGFVHDLGGRIALAVLITGCVLFAGDLALRAFAGTRLFAFAAPLGGILMIAGWLAMALSALLGLRRAG